MRTEARDCLLLGRSCREVGPDLLRQGIWTQGTDLRSNKKKIYIFTLNEMQNFNFYVYI